MSLTDQALGLIVLAEILAPLTLVIFVLTLPVSGRNCLLLACTGLAICAAAALALVTHLANDGHGGRAVVISTATLMGREPDEAAEGKGRDGAPAGGNRATTPGGRKLFQPALRVDRLSAGMLALLAWLSLTGLLSDPRDQVREHSGHIAAVLGLHGSTALCLAAADFLLLLTGLAMSAVIAAAAIGLWGGRDKRMAAAGLLTIQIVSLFGMSAAIAIEAAAVSLMQAAPFGIPQSTSFNLEELLRLFDDARRHHPAATVVHSQLAGWLVAAASVPLWLLPAVFPLHGWFLPVWKGAPVSVRIWLGGIGTKLPLVALIGFLGPFSGDAYGTLIGLYATAAVLGLFVSCCLVAVRDDLDRVSGAVVLAGTHLAVLLVCAGETELFLPLVVLSAGMVLLTLPLDLLAAGRRAGDERGESGEAISSLWLLPALVMGMLAMGMVPGGVGFEIWRKLAAMLWMEPSLLNGWGGWIVLFSGLIVTCELTWQAGRLASDSAGLSGRPAQTSAEASRKDDGRARQTVVIPAALRAVLFVWGLVALSASVLVWIGPVAGTGQGSDRGGAADAAPEAAAQIRSVERSRLREP